MRLMLIAFLIALLPACSERIEVPAKPVEPHIPRKITIHGEDADAFYKNLRFAVEGDCKKSLTYQYLAASRLPLASEQKNQNMFSTLELMLFGELYVARFVEYIPRKHAFENPVVLRERIFEGFYVIKDGILVLKGLGTGFGVMQFGSRALILSIEDSLASSKKVLVLKKIYSKEPPMERFRVCR